MTPSPDQNHDAAEAKSTASEKSVDALVVSGFLGSGKTTLVAHLLACAKADGVRVAVVSNEFGELGIDEALLGEGDFQMVELEGGCVCCKLGDELLDTLVELRERVDPDRIIVETSGVALPYDTLLNFWRPPVDAWIRDEAAVVVVNAEQVSLGYELQGTFEDQVCSADLLIVNKTDLIDAAALARVDAFLRDLEPDVPIIHATQGMVQTEAMFPPDPDGARETRRNSSESRPHTHESFTSEIIDIEDDLDETELRSRLADLAPLRAKGFIRQGGRLMLVQGVGHRLEIRPFPGARPKNSPANKPGRLVVIRRQT